MSSSSSESLTAALSLEYEKNGLLLVLQHGDVATDALKKLPFELCSGSASDAPGYVASCMDSSDAPGYVASCMDSVGAFEAHPDLQMMVEAMDSFV
jgi:hypothetical protein